MDLDPRRLLVLKAIADAPSLAEAARLLGHTPSAVSQQLAKLEREAGVELVHRRPGGTGLTEAGRVLARSGERISESIAEAERELAGLTGRLDGPVGVGVLAGGTLALALSLVPELARTRPELVPTIVETGVEDGLARLRRGELEVLVVSDDRDSAVEVPPGCAARVLIEDEYRLVVPDSWEVPEGAAELSGRPWIGAAPETARGRCFARFARTHGIVPSVEHLALTPDSLSAMAAARLGAFLCPWFFADWLANSTVTDVPVPGAYLARVLYRTTPAGEAVTRALHELSLARSEDLVEAGVHRRDILVRRLPDPGSVSAR